MESDKGCCIELHAPGSPLWEAEVWRDLNEKREKDKQRRGARIRKWQVSQVSDEHPSPVLRKQEIRASKIGTWGNEMRGCRASPCRPQWKSSWIYSKYVVVLVAETVKDLPTIWETWVLSLVWVDRLKKGMATHANILAWRITWTEEPGRLQSVGS